MNKQELQSILERNNNSYDSFLEKESKISNKSLVEMICTFDCFLNAFSSDQIGQLLESAKAKYGSSFIESLWGDNLVASIRNCPYSFFGITSISFFKIDNVKIKSDIDIPVNFIILSFLEINSSSTNSGVIRLQSLFNNSSATFLLIESNLKNEKRMLASTINILGRVCIFSQSPCLFATLSLSSFASLSACSSVSWDFDIISFIIENSNLLINCLTTLDKASSNSLFNSIGISILIITSAMQKDSVKTYLKVLSYCEDHAIMLSKKIELVMKDIMESDGTLKKINLKSNSHGGRKNE